LWQLSSNRPFLRALPMRELSSATNISGKSVNTSIFIVNSHLFESFCKKHYAFAVDVYRKHQIFQKGKGNLFVAVFADVDVRRSVLQHIADFPDKCTVLQRYTATDDVFHEKPARVKVQIAFF